MSGHSNGDWHAVHGGGLPFRPPTVDEALPYSPFTSIVPFSPDVIPFPVNEPPTPPSTLSPDQQTAARRAVGILNDEIRGQSPTALHLEQTLWELRNLLGNPHEMTEFRFKPTAQLATPPPDSPTKPDNEPPAATSRPKLSPFAAKLLNQTEVHFLPEGHQVQQQPSSKTVHSHSAAPPRKSSQSMTPKGQTAPPDRNSRVSEALGTPTAIAANGPSRPGPSVVIKPSATPKDEFQLIDQVPEETRTQRHRADDSLSTLRPEEREVAEQKIDRLRRIVKRLNESREDLESDQFEKLSCLDSDVNVLTKDALKILYDRVMAVDATKCFSSVPVEVILSIHSLCEPSITATDQSSIFREGELDSWAHDLRIVDLGLLASKLVLTTMLKGPRDRRTSPEDLLTSIVQMMKRVLEACISPILASRRDTNSELFAYASSHKSDMQLLLGRCTGVQELLAQAIGKVPFPDNALNAVEYLALALVVQQNSESEKDSALGLKQFEKLRRAAMNVVTHIFAAYPDHQHFITEEILNNLDKLPDKGPNIRQFKSAREDSIMAVSALFMQFVQVAATNNINSSTAPQEQQSSGDEGSESSSEDESDGDRARKLQTNRNKKHDQSAESTARTLMQTAGHIAKRIATTLVERATNASKSGEKSYRVLLELFIDDFCKVLGSPEWPAATLLLAPLFNSMARHLQTNSKDMAISILGNMACGIIAFKKRVRELKRDMNLVQSNISSKLDQLVEETLEKDDDHTGMNRKDIMTCADPFRMVLESLPDYLDADSASESVHLLSVRGCYVTCCLDSIYHVTGPATDGEDEQALSKLQHNAESMILDTKWSAREYKYQDISVTQSRLAAAIIALKSSFCQNYTRLVRIMFSQIHQGQANQKSRALANLQSFVELDHQAISEQYVLNLVHILGDNSPLVRTNVVALISKCLAINPEMDRLCLQGVMRLATDTHNGPKKRAINLLKEIYLRSDQLHTKLEIVNALLPASQDHEKQVSDMARQALEEVWLKALGTDTKGDETRYKLQRTERVSLLVQTVRKAQISPTPKPLQAFTNFFFTALGKSAPNLSANFSICKDLVADLVEGVISPETMAEGCTQDVVLQTLSIFARVSPEMFTFDQIQLLKLYIRNPTSMGDVEMLRSTVTVFRFVIPHLQNLQTDFADDVRNLLSKLISKLASSAGKGNSTAKHTLIDTVHCLWIMRSLTTNGVARLLATVGSTMVNLVLTMPSSTSTDAQNSQMNRIISFIILTGTFGKLCDWSAHSDLFKTSISKAISDRIAAQPATEQLLKGLVSKLGSAPHLVLLEAVKPFTKQAWNLNIRESALSAVGEICQGSPGLFQRKEVETIFKVVFMNEINSLKEIALTQFHDFLVRAEGRIEHEPNPTEGNTSKGGGKLGITFQAGDGQVTTNYLARQFLEEIVDVALNHNDALALVATNTVISISRQGLVHPKECGPALIALGSSLNPQIAQAAILEHQDIHTKHETMFEKEYMTAVRMAFEYQRGVFHEPHGMSAPPECRPKLMHVFTVMKNGSRKTLKRFIDNISKLTDFDLPSLADPDAGLTTLLFARFCLENLGLFDVQQLSDVATITNTLESIVLKNTGPTVGVAIDIELPRTSTSASQLQQNHDGTGDTTVINVQLEEPVRNDHQNVSDDRLLQITRACMILQMMWETRRFVLKAYNITKPGRISQKDYQKPASRNNLIKNSDLWQSFDSIFNSVEHRADMIKHCHDFATLLEVDKDANFNEDGDENGGYATPEEEDEPGSAAPTSGKGRKRKSSASLSNTPKKARGRSAGAKNKKRASKTPDGDDWD